MKRGTVIFLTAILGIVVAMLLAYLFVVDRPASGPPATLAAASAPALTAKLMRATGDVKVRVANQDWHAAQDGAELSVGTEVQTGEDANAELAYGDEMRIQLVGDTNVSLGDLRSNLTRLIVGQGLVLADVRAGSGRRLQIANRSGEAIAETSDGALAVSSTVGGALRAAVTRGTAVLSANGGTVTVASGFFSVAGSGQKPSVPVAVPSTLLLKVKWPQVSATAKRQQIVHGNTTAGTRVRVNDSVVWSDDSGRFRTVIDLQEGKHRIRIRAVDMIGREVHEVSPEIELDTSKPVPKIETSPAMWQQSSSAP